VGLFVCLFGCLCLHCLQLVSCYGDDIVELKPTINFHTGMSKVEIINKPEAEKENFLERPPCLWEGIIQVNIYNATF